MKISFLTNLSLLISSIIAASSSVKFSLEIDAPGTVLENAKISLNSDYTSFLISDTTDVGNDSITGQILTNTSLLVNDQLVAGIGKNYLSLKGSSSSFKIADPWTIENGYLKLYGSDFHAVPSGDEGVYVLGSINAAVGRDTVITIGIKAIGQDGIALGSFPAIEESSIVESSTATISSSQTFTSIITTPDPQLSSTSLIPSNTDHFDTSSTLFSRSPEPVGISSQSDVVSSQIDPTSSGSTQGVGDSSSFEVSTSLTNTGAFFTSLGVTNLSAVSAVSTSSLITTSVDTSATGTSTVSSNALGTFSEDYTITTFANGVGRVVPRLAGGLIALIAALI